VSERVVQVGAFASLQDERALCLLGLTTLTPVSNFLAANAAIAIYVNLISFHPYFFIH
jgi:hypothetical protein